MTEICFFLEHEVSETFVWLKFRVCCVCREYNEADGGHIN